MTDQITQTQLENGLKILLKEIHSAPIISHWVWYRVGSRYETPGKTGISHWVEHMQFKGTPKYPAGESWTGQSRGMVACGMHSLILTGRPSWRPCPAERLN